ncbi:hypothetical protein CLAVI_000315 [Candidatus Clavichlamydia salmonicola]|uniref:hypothetical protein n=1 Tax=Candidatus Clavichlamydia salmonicola TaxID=469812 RepID=UPI001890D8C0|nr:hypothetical protein [Candidatus Clavichlamydia salmonicola]MBF5050700.1 hypothetical protein [Candidatus Clavichlamydia salmonicola]
MAILSRGDLVPVVNNGNHENFLSASSPFIQSWCKGLHEFFFGINGILVAGRRNGNDEVVYPFISVSFMLSRFPLLNEHANIQIIIISARLSSGNRMTEYLERLELGLYELMQIVRQQNTGQIFRVSSKINKQCFAKVNLNNFSFMQLVASLLRFYKDVLTCDIFVLEEVKRQELKRLLDQVSENTENVGHCNALKEMILHERMKIIECQNEKVQVVELETIFLELCVYMQIYDYDANGERRSGNVVRGISLEDVSNWLVSLPEEVFCMMLVLYGEELPANCIGKAWKEKGSRFLIGLLKKNSITALKMVPLDVLEQALREISTADLIVVLQDISLKTLINILIKVPKYLLKNILLELPKDVLGNLKQSTAGATLIKQVEGQIDEYLSELQLLQKKNPVYLKKIARPFLCLRSLAASAICKAPYRSLVGQGVQALSLTYMERMAMLYPTLQEEVRSQIRVRVKMPVEEGFPEFIFEDVPGSDYLPQLDLLSLASLLPGYKGIFEKRMLKKCGNKE